MSEQEPTRGRSADQIALERVRMRRARDAADALIEAWAQRVDAISDDFKRHRSGLG